MNRRHPPTTTRFHADFIRIEAAMPKAKGLSEESAQRAKLIENVTGARSSSRPLGTSDPPS